MEILFWVFVGLFVLTFIGWIISLFFTKKTLVPMWSFLFAMLIFNAGIQITVLFI